MGTRHSQNDVIVYFNWYWLSNNVINIQFRIFIFPAFRGKYFLIIGSIRGLYSWNRQKCEAGWALIDWKITFSSGDLHFKNQCEYCSNRYELIRTCNDDRVHICGSPAAGICVSTYSSKRTAFPIKLIYYIFRCFLYEIMAKINLHKFENSIRVMCKRRPINYSPQSSHPYFYMKENVFQYIFNWGVK